MSTLNSIPFTVAGDLTADPELRFTGTGKPVAGVRIAVTPRRFDRDTNSYIDGTTTFVDGQVWGEQAEHLAESVHKGDRVLVIGRWVTRVFTPSQGPNEGVEQRRLEVVVDEIGPSLAWATAVVTRTGTTADPAPVATVGPVCRTIAVPFIQWLRMEQISILMFVDRFLSSTLPARSVLLA